MALRGIDQTFIQPLQDVNLNGFEFEALGLLGDPQNERVSPRFIAEQPVKEICLDRVKDTECAKGLPIKQVSPGFRQVSGQGQSGNGLGEDDKICVLKEEFRRVDLRAIGNAQQPIP